MSAFFSLWLLFFILQDHFCDAKDPTPAKLKVLYNSLDPHSIPQHLALYELYPNTKEGQQALQDAYSLLAGRSTFLNEAIPLPSSFSYSIDALIGLVNKNSDSHHVELTKAELACVDRLASRLPNRKLPGYRIQSEEELLKLKPSEIDLAHGILISQFGSSQPAFSQIRSYEAAIDLMALQILTRISLTDSPKAKVRALNHFIFEEIGFRFPPHSSYSKEIDHYTFLPSVLDSRRGVCLGVSILYICLAQRLNLDLEIVTPPGHIFVRWHEGDETINIETTARGIHLKDEDYLGMDTLALQQRNVKETIGMAYFNQASVFWERDDYDKAMESYRKAQLFLPDDKQLIELMGYISLLQGDEKQGKMFLQQIRDHIPDHAVSKNSIAEDYLSGNVGSDAIKAIFKHVDETRLSLLEKRQELERILQKYPKFREGLFSLAGIWLQLHRTGEALEVLERYHEIDQNNATIEYYLAALYAERTDYNNAWKHFRLSEALVKRRGHEPKALSTFRQELASLCPE